MILQKITFVEKNKNAKTVDDFYYRELEEKLQGKQGTGVRNLSADFIRSGKIVNRFLILKEEGSTLEVYTIFKTMADLNEFNDHPISVEARKFWEDKCWNRTIEIYPIEDYLDIRHRLDRLKSVI